MSQWQPVLDKREIVSKLAIAYGDEQAERLFNAINDLTVRYEQEIKPRAKPWVDERDVMLITYGDSIQERGKAPLQSLHEFLKQRVSGMINAVHLLPFYPYSSDDGFSVTDYYTVNPAVGSWHDVQAMAQDFDLMFDAVINHVSQQSEWFQKYLAGDSDYVDFFIDADPEQDYSTVIRPRALPLLSAFEAVEGKKHLWTTFSDDQIDLNYANPKVLLSILELLLFYAKRGARFLRFDAIGFLWKKMGTTCMHLPETHAIVQVMRAVVEAAAPGTLIISETNVPHKDNIGYFGNGYNEAHMVYQFPLPPLTLHAFHSGSAKYLSQWAASLEPTTEKTTFFNFLASHDGIGLRPVEGILDPAEIDAMVDRVEANHGLVSYRDKGDGTQSPYELNINYLDAVTLPGDSDAERAKKFIASQAILLSLAGVPGIYIHSLVGSRNDLEGVKETGRSRSINREKLQRSHLERALDTLDSLRSQVFHAYQHLLQIRRNQAVFHPNAGQKVLFLDDRVFSLVRTRGSSQLLALINVSNELVTTFVPSPDIQRLNTHKLIDLLTNQALPPQQGAIVLTLEPYQILWITE